jgi:hypothetical protein
MQVISRCLESRRCTNMRFPTTAQKLCRSNTGFFSFDHSVRVNYIGDEVITKVVFESNLNDLQCS